MNGNSLSDDVGDVSGEFVSDTSGEPLDHAVGRRRRARRAEGREELEARLAALAEDVRAKSEEALRKRREETVLEARAHAEGILPVQSNAPAQIEGEKIVVAPGVDPKRDPTVVGRRTEGGKYEFSLPLELLEDEAPPAVPEEAVPRGEGLAHGTGSRRSLVVMLAVGFFVIAALWLVQSRRPAVKVLGSIRLTVVPIVQVPEPEPIDPYLLELARRGALVSTPETPPSTTEPLVRPKSSSLPKVVPSVDPSAGEKTKKPKNGKTPLAGKPEY